MEKQALSEIGFVERPCRPLHPDFLRVVQWNVEKGKRWELLEQCLRADDIASADILCLNECDYGMARSGNRHVAFEIAARLGMTVIFGPSFFEYTKGIGVERASPGSNSASLQGNAILTRLEVVERRNLLLPQCHDPGLSVEKRAGARTALIARLRWNRDMEFALVATHLEVFTTRKCREAQMRNILEELGAAGPAIIAGDFNSNTFDRGSRMHSVISVLRLLGPAVKRRTATPWESEAMFDRLREQGFSWKNFNDDEPTNLADLSILEDRSHLPEFIVRSALRRGRFLPLRLDWIVCRGFRAVHSGRTITGLPCQPSDHLPISCDLVPLA